MSIFTPATTEQRFVLEHIVRLSELSEEATPDLVEAVLDGVGAFAAGEWAPLDRLGDTDGPKWTEQGVKMPAGFASAYKAYVEGGWGTIGSPAEFGGQGLPVSLSIAVLETLGSANMGFALAPILTVGAVEALMHHGSPEQQAAYLPKLSTGEWTGTMNLTEPQAGSDVGAVRSIAAPVGDGTYRVKGTKIFISFGDHDMADNIIHLVLARTPTSRSITSASTRTAEPRTIPRTSADRGSRASNSMRVSWSRRRRCSAPMSSISTRSKNRSPTPPALAHLR